MPFAQLSSGLGHAGDAHCCGSRLVLREMSWNNADMEVHYPSASYPYNSAGSFIEYFEGLTYEHVNFIFEGGSHVQNAYPLTNSSFYKFGMPQHGNTYYDYSHPCEVHDHISHVDEYRRPLENNPSAMGNDRSSAVNTQWQLSENPAMQGNSRECPRNHRSSQDYEVIWQDHVDPDSMSYEELLELGETVGTQGRGLPQELISLLPVSKYKRSFFWKRKSRSQRCVICQMEYKRGERRITLPCKHVYHANCGTKWLGINKACPICYTEVFGDKLKH